MDSIINEKKRLHETLLSFPPFYTYRTIYAASRNMRSRERNKLGIGPSSYIHTAESKADQYAGITLSTVRFLKFGTFSFWRIDQRSFQVLYVRGRKAIEGGYTRDFERSGKTGLLIICDRQLKDTYFPLQSLRNG
jgi:hypothetical protein